MHASPLWASGTRNREKWGLFLLLCDQVKVIIRSLDIRVSIDIFESKQSPHVVVVDSPAGGWGVVIGCGVGVHRIQYDTENRSAQTQRPFGPSLSRRCWLA